MPRRARAWSANSTLPARARSGRSAIPLTSCYAARAPPLRIPSMPERTPSQTVGPYLHLGLAPAGYNFRPLFGATLAEPGLAGKHIRIAGHIRDGEGNVLPDALIEIWQADSEGRYAHPADGRALRSNAFRGFGRTATDAQGGFCFASVKPGGVPGPNGSVQAPHINVGIFARGVLKRLFTRIYFAGEA